MTTKKKQNKKRHYPLREAELSLQFYRDKNGTGNFLITSNPEIEGKDFCSGMDAYIFARNLVGSPLVSFAELKFFCDFFDEVRKRLHEDTKQLKPFVPPEPKLCPVTLVGRLLGIIEKLK